MPRALLSAALLFTGCDDTGFGQRFEPPPGDTDVAAFLRLPVQPGDGYYFIMDSTYDPDPVSSGTANEKQVQGRYCVSIASVEDKYPSNQESTITARIKITGSSSTQPIFVQDQQSGGTPAGVVAYMAPLWVTALTPPALSHGFNSPTLAPAFATRSSLAPPDQSFTSLMFFDPRPSTDTTWRGWNDYLVDYLQEFTLRFGPNITTNPDFDFDIKEPQGCTAHTTSGACNGSGRCIWDFGLNTCTGAFKIETIWRERGTINYPGEFNGQTVLHYVIAQFTEDGVLKLLREYMMVDDTTGDLRLDASTIASRCRNRACLTGGFERHSLPWNDLTCTF